MITKKGEVKNNQLLFGLLISGYGSSAWLLEEMPLLPLSRWRCCRCPLTVANGAAVLRIDGREWLSSLESRNNG
jgi:hypothetical protein